MKSIYILTAGDKTNDYENYLQRTELSPDDIQDKRQAFMIETSGEYSVLYMDEIGVCESMVRLDKWMEIND